MQRDVSEWAMRGDFEKIFLFVPKQWQSRLRRCTYSVHLSNTCVCVANCIFPQHKMLVTIAVLFLSCCKYKISSLLVRCIKKTAMRWHESESSMRIQAKNVKRNKWAQLDGNECRMWIQQQKIVVFVVAALLYTFLVFFITSSYLFYSHRNSTELHTWQWSERVNSIWCIWRCHYTPSHKMSYHGEHRNNKSDRNEVLGDNFFLCHHTQPNGKATLFSLTHYAQTEYPCGKIE